MKLPDVQNTTPDVFKPVDLVGVKGVVLPFKIKESNNGGEETLQKVICTISASVSLSSFKRGISMSRIVRVLNRYVNYEINKSLIKEILENLCKSLQSEKAKISIEFLYLRKKQAPKSMELGWVYYPIVLSGFYDSSDKDFSHWIKVGVNYTSLCECSKEISENGAHNQRSLAELFIFCDDKDDLPVVDSIIDVVEKNASCEVYSVLKRVDEKYVTEKAYKRPRFVETMSRNISQSLEQLGFENFTIVVTHYESIHQHDAFSVIYRGKIKMVPREDL